MFSKLYEKIKKLIIKNHNFILFLILITIVLNIKTPYIVKAPGGTIPVSNRIYINGKNIKADLNTTYMKVVEGKVAGVLASFVFPNWDLEKYEEYNGDTNLSYEELDKVEKLMMIDGNNKAILTALKKAGVDYETKNHKQVVYYKYDEYENDLKIGDIINSCNDKKITTIDDLHDCVNNSKDFVTLNILRNNKEKEIKTNVYSEGSKKLIGIGVLDTFDISSKYDIKIKLNSSESGSSGGFMTTLGIYTEISNIKIPKDIKIAGTGTIEDDEKIGKIDGVKYKLIGCENDNVDIFFVPKENYKEAIKAKKKYKLKLKIIKVECLDDAINYLNSLNS